MYTKNNVRYGNMLNECENNLFIIMVMYIDCFHDITCIIIKV